MQPYKVLIVEDDPMVSMINEQYVRKNKGFEVAGSCRNGQEALEFLKKNEVDLIVLDVFMPVMDGIETLKQIRASKIPAEVIMVTAANDTSTLEQTMHLGVIDYLIKPFAFERFQVALENFSGKYSALKQTSTLDQSSVDSIISNTSRNAGIPVKNDSKLPKGIQEQTLNLIFHYFESNSGWQTSDLVAEKLGLSIVTVRHYLNYLESRNIIVRDINYSTGGRPCMLYKKN